MPIHFSPPLGTTTPVAIPIANSGVVLLRFTATLSADEYDDLERNNTRIQLWSDLPALGSGRAAGQWGELTFQREDAGIVDSGVGGAGVGTAHFRAALNGVSDPANGHDHKAAVKLLLEASIQLPGSSTLNVVGTWQYSFTYRLVSTTGEMSWLGDFRNGDGVLILSSDPRIIENDPQLTLNATAPRVTQGWSSENDNRPASNDTTARSYVCDLDYDPEKDCTMPNALEVLQLGRSPKYHVSGVSKSGSLILHPHIPEEIQDAYMLLFTPRSTFEDILIPPTLLLSASPDGWFSLTGDEHVIFAHGSGRIFLQVLEARPSTRVWASSVQEALAQCTPDVQFVTLGHDDDFIVLSSAKSITPVQALILPSPGTRARSVPIPVQTLASFLSDVSDEGMQLSIFSDIVKAAGIYSTDDVHTIAFTTDSAGAKVLLSAVYPLAGVVDRGNEVEGFLLVSFITPYIICFDGTSTNGLDPLPTPPPSPPKRILDTSVTNESLAITTPESESSTCHLDSDAMSPSTSKSTVFSDIPPSSVSEMSTSISSHTDVSYTSSALRSTSVTSTSEGSLILHPLGLRRSRGSVVACMALFVHMARVFIKSVFCRVFYLLFGTGTRVPRQERVEQVEKKEVNETTPLLSRETEMLSEQGEYEEKNEIRNEDSTDGSESVDVNGSTVSRIDPISVSEALLDPIPSRPTGLPGSEYICVDVPAGKTSFIVWDTTINKKSKDIVVSLDGQPIKIYPEGGISRLDTPGRGKMQVWSFELDKIGQVKLYTAQNLK